MKMTANSLITDLDKLIRGDCHLKYVTSILSELTSIMKSGDVKSVLNPDSWKTVLKVTRIVQAKLREDILENYEMDFLAEYLRFIRNSCGNGISENQQFILSCEEIVDCVKETIVTSQYEKPYRDVIILKCAIQVIGNLVCLSTDAKVLVWNYFLQQDTFQTLLEHKNCKVQEYIMMVLFNCMTEETTKHLISSRTGHQILISLLESLRKELVDWGILFLEVVLKHEVFFQNCYEIIPIKSRLLILDIIIQQLNTSEGHAFFTEPQSSLSYIVDFFVQYVRRFVEICDKAAYLRALEVIKLLSLLGDASVLECYCHILKSKRELLETLVETLRCVHLLGKSGNKDFSRVSNLEVKTDKHRDELENNPTYGFKKNLIRLIGNLCFNCRENQDTVRELDGIPLLLDCCNVDARNPFILQWSLLALRNIMEKNPENQAFLAEVSAEGEVDSAVFAELGFEAKKEDGKYILRSLQL